MGRNIHKEERKGGERERMREGDIYVYIKKCIYRDRETDRQTDRQTDRER